MHRTIALKAASILALALAASPGIAETAPPAAGAAPDGAACPLWQGGHGHGQGQAQGPGGRWLSQLQDLGLSGEQRQAIQDVMERYRARGMELAQRASGIREQMTGVAPDDPGYAAATAKAAEAAALLAADAVRLASELRAEVHALLTEEQRQRLRDQVQQDRQRWDDWRESHRAPQ